MSAGRPWTAPRPLTGGAPSRWRVQLAGAPAGALMLPAGLAVLSSLFAGPTGLALGLLSAGAFGIASVVLRDGLRAEAAARLDGTGREGPPAKLWAALLTGAGAGLAALAHGAEAWGAAVYAAISLALLLVAFGVDAPRAVVPDARTGRLKDEAEGYLADMASALAPLSDPAMSDRVAGLARDARRLLRATDDAGLTDARRLLGPYLMGARDAVAGYVGRAARAPDPAARTEVAGLLDDLGRILSARADAAQGAAGRETLDIEIAVLRDRLAQEARR